MYLPTLKEDPAEAEIVSHKLMLRSGMLRKVATGVYTYMPLGFRALKKVENIVRQEMNRIDAQEVLMPVLQPAELWQTSGRWYAYGDEMMRLNDRHQREFCLGPTHEELVTSMAREIRSYKELPVILYQIQVKFRDEVRPRFGVMRSREFIMKDAYSFHADRAGLDETYVLMHEAYSRIVSRCGLDYRSVRAAAGLIGGAVSEEFHVLADTGEDTIIFCPECAYAANLELASSRWHLPEPDEELKPLEKVETPGKISVSDVTKYLDVPESKLVKTLIYKDDTGALLGVLIPGHKAVNPAKLSLVLGKEITLLDKDDFKTYPQLVYGYIGPIGLYGISLIADLSLKKLRNFIVGANEADFHFKNVNVGRDFTPDIWEDIIYAEEGDACSQCSAGVLQKLQGIEIGHIFQLGTKYSEKMGVTYVDRDGKSKPFIMGCYGVGVSRLVAAAIEQKSDARGIVWPISIAPFHVHLLAVGKDEKVKETAEELYNHLLAEGIEVLYDDRSVSAGIKFAEADLIGLPLQIIIGKKFMETKKIEVKSRTDAEITEVAHDSIVGWLKDKIHNELLLIDELRGEQKA